MILELQNETGTPQQQQQQQQQQAAATKSSIRALQKRFEEVSTRIQIVNLYATFYPLTTLSFSHSLESLEPHYIHLYTAQNSW